MISDAETFSPFVSWLLVLGVAGIVALVLYGGRPKR